MGLRLDRLLNTVFKIISLSLAFLIPLLFWNSTTEFFEIPKFIALTVVLLLLLLLWGAKFIIEGKVKITRTSLDLPLLLMLAAFIISTIFANSRWVAIMGNIPRVHGGLASFAVYILLYFVLISGLKQKTSAGKQIKRLLLISGAVIAAISLFSYAGKYVLMLPWTFAPNFTPTGSSFSTNAILSLLLPTLLTQILGVKKSEDTGKFGKISLGKVVAVLLLTLFMATIILTGNWVVYVAAGVGILISLFVTPLSLAKKNILYLILPAIVSLILIVSSYLPLGGSYNLIYPKAQNFPREIQLPLGISWKISISAFRDTPFWGSGPATFISDFTAYKPAEFNNLKFWTIKFDQPFNEYFYFLATLGGLGVITLLLFTVMALGQAFKVLKEVKNETDVSLAVSVIVFFVLLLLHTSTLVLWATGVLILAAFMLIHRDLTEQLQVRIAATKSKEDQLHFDALPVILAIVVLLLVGFTTYFLSRFALADLHHRNALNAVASNKALDAYNELVSAERLNPYVDLYRTDLAQTNFAIAEAIASSKVSADNNNATSSLTDEDKNNIQKFLSQSINEAKAAVAINGANSTNWEVLGSIYSQVSGVAQNATAFSLDAYGQALQRDPLNPLLRLTVGGIYYSAKSYDMAIRFFTDSINLKPDFVNGYYNLALALRDKGDLQTAIAVAEKAVSLVDPKSQDYKLALELLNNLKDASPTPTPAAQKNSATPSAQVNSKLQDKNMPKVLDLPKSADLVTPPPLQTPEQ